MVIDDLEYIPETGEFFRKGKKLGGTRSKYITLRFKGKVHKAHKVAWFFYYGEWPSSQIDHIERNKKNNSIQNLRLVDTSTNCHNQFGARVSNKETGLQGVKVVKYRSGTIRYRAVICIDKVDIHLGMYGTAEEAHQVYMNRKKELLIERTTTSNTD